MPVSRRRFTGLAGLWAALSALPAWSAEEPATEAGSVGGLNPDNTGRKAPALFIGHGDPMNILQDNRFTRDWDTLAARFDSAEAKPRAILMVSAHWETRGVAVSVAENPAMIYDFYGFPDQMYQQNYPARGAPEIAAGLTKAILSQPVIADPRQGLDHGAWCVLMRLFPKADVPVFQFSLSRNMNAAAHYALGQELRQLREQGVMIIGSGNITHNMRSWQQDYRMGRTHVVHDWAKYFDDQVTQRINNREYAALADYLRYGRAAQMSVPTPEHYLPLLYVAASAYEAEQAEYFAEGFEAGSFSMRSVLFNG
ncbi:4,5-DOPA-extradiol-dioxygenase [Aliamphritea hakodatensis]|uniref:4,5-DOPA-extradiol-dioxygenase n=1 Tax=Aliamphritea hakodatensis TaxID=2895352 RepID=UPI0022FD8C13|nr:4,5-DOPA dioxygenase extradiol [Aliamphritea hakodatensis]